MEIFRTIPDELYSDDAECFIASRNRFTVQDVVRCLLVQNDIVPASGGDAPAVFSLENNEMEIIRGLLDAYRSTDGNERENNVGPTDL